MKMPVRMCGSRQMIGACLAAASLACLPGAAEARTYKYTYTGMSYDGNATGCLAGTSARHLVFVMVLATALPANASMQVNPLTWSFNDGVDIFKKGTKNISSFLSVGTDARGSITTWNLQAKVLPKSNKVLFQVLSSFNGDYFTEEVNDHRCAGGGYGETTVPGGWRSP